MDKLFVKNCPNCGILFCRVYLKYLKENAAWEVELTTQNYFEIHLTGL